MGLSQVFIYLALFIFNNVATYIVEIVKKLP